ncbi:MAG: hypothetical protein QXO71_01170 [Candidatus Jordarchaeaceae archaeon]
MVEINNLMEEIANASLEKNTKIASLALVSDTGKVVYQTKNWDLSNQTKIILDVVRGNKEFVLNNVKFSILSTDPARIVGVNKGGMGAVLILKCKGGFLISYVMPKASTEVALNFLEQYVKKINEIK